MNNLLKVRRLCVACGFWYDNTTIDGKEINYSIDNPFKKIPVEYIFLYDQKTGHFKAKEDYAEKYKLLE
ncbi:hypothetical protein [Chryseobacterium sp. JV558]|uniref:hypothetical protein n=1 Tax=Chryseobacterium sp. JV558 TaxID=2663236 RepID=UPI00299D97DE|nr:hypothetical protein [Chryseobacterium sp. JV558]MDW9378702.1 hypothetical protein [Chryseobacterium sp. JV558]